MPSTVWQCVAMTPKTGWPSGLMQDDCKKLSQWFASRLDARRMVREACAQIQAERAFAFGAQHGVRFTAPEHSEVTA